MSTQVDAPVIRPYCIYKGQPVYARAAVMVLLRKSDRTMRRYVEMGRIGFIRLGRTGRIWGLLRSTWTTSWPGCHRRNRGRSKSGGFMEAKGMLKIVCCNCKKLMGYKPVFWDTEGQTMITHGICEECGPKLYPTLWKKEGVVNGKVKVLDGYVEKDNETGC